MLLLVLFQNVLRRRVAYLAHQNTSGKVFFFFNPPRQIILTRVVDLALSISSFLPHSIPDKQR